MEDEKYWISRILEGNTESFSILVSQYQGKLFKFILGLTSNKEDAEEILQDTFVRVYHYLHRYNPKWSFSTWIYQITTNTFKDYYKKRKKRENFEFSCDYSDTTYSIGTRSIESIYESKEHYLEVVKQIHCLKPNYRIALVLRCVQGNTYTEIADIMGISTVNAKVLVNRARNSIGMSLNKKVKEGAL